MSSFDLGNYAKPGRPQKVMKYNAAMEKIQAQFFCDRGNYSGVEMVKKIGARRGAKIEMTRLCFTGTHGIQSPLMGFSRSFSLCAS